MKYQSKIVDGHEVYFSADWIDDLEKEIHFSWYYHQADIVYSNCSRNQKMLEIGIGTGLLSDLLKKRGWDIKTLDIDEKKNPDFCDSAVGFDYEKQSIQVVLAFEVFEHMSFSIFEKVIYKLDQHNVTTIYFSLPWNERRILDLNLKIAKLPSLIWRLAIPAGRINTRTHFWELGKKEKTFGDKKLITLKSMIDIFLKNEYKISCLKRIENIQYFSAEKTG
ncbi:MAG: class I SAM-dependent methyltransferase [Candidatus Electrothrix sp. YB6]